MYSLTIFLPQKFYNIFGKVAATVTGDEPDSGHVQIIEKLLAVKVTVVVIGGDEE